MPSTTYGLQIFDQFRCTWKKNLDVSDDLGKKNLMLLGLIKKKSPNHLKNLFKIIWKKKQIWGGGVDLHVAKSVGRNVPNPRLMGRPYPARRFAYILIRN